MIVISFTRHSAMATYSAGCHNMPHGLPQGDPNMNDDADYGKTSALSLLVYDCTSFAIATISTRR